MHDSIDWSDAAVRWPVRLAMAMFAIAYLMRLSGSSPRRVRAVWTAGFVAFLMHMAAAFHFVHFWSHDAAFDATARQSFEQTGLAWGGGIFANYAFAGIWGGDVVDWWIRGLGRPRYRWTEIAIHAYLGFIAFNATVVFAHGWVRWAGVLACVAIAIGSCFRRTGSSG